MTNRRNQILKTAIEMIADEGYAALSMRALARAAQMKLGALQYHFRTSDDLLRAVVSYIANAYDLSFDSLRRKDNPPSVRDLVIFVLDDEAGKNLLDGGIKNGVCHKCNARLWGHFVKHITGDRID